MAENYLECLKQKEEEWEARCLRCGGCCGAFDDPCRHLKKSFDDKYFCEIYNCRFGERTTVAGHNFNCVPINKLLHVHWPGSHLCAYRTKTVAIHG